MSAFVAGCDSKAARPRPAAARAAMPPRVTRAPATGATPTSAKAEAVEKLALQILSMAPVKTAVERGLEDARGE